LLLECSTLKEYDTPARIQIECKNTQTQPNRETDKQAKERVQAALAHNLVTPNYKQVLQTEHGG